MRVLMRSGSRLAFVIALGIAPMVSCSSDPNPSTNVASTGTLGLPLQAMGASGAVYRLRNAFFQIQENRTGNVVDFLFSEDAPLESPELRKVLETGNYTVTLLEGWHIERIRSGSGGSGGTGGTDGAGGFAGDFGTGGFAGDFESGGFGNLGGETGSAGEADSGGEAGTIIVGGRGGSGNTGGTGFAGKGGTSGKGGGKGGAPGEVGEIVEAQLVSDALQPFSIFGFSESFVTYTFHVGEEELDFEHGRVHIGIEIIEGADSCEVPPDFLDPGRVLMETNLDAVNQVALIDVLTALVTNGGATGDAQRLYHELIDTYASADNARLPDAIHCGDEVTDGAPSLNGYPITCDRQERFQFDNLFGFFPMAFVNRIDLAPLNGAHCGQQRMIFGNNRQNRMFIIAEAQIPNPAPEAGIQGCAPLARFWLDQNAISDPVERGLRLARAFLVGAPELEDFGFGPFYTATNLTVGSGQIRTNQFDQDPWTLREFKLGLDGEAVTVIPFPVSESPNGQLWNEDSAFEQGAACRDSFIAAIPSLVTNDPSAMSFVVDHACKDAESRNDGSQFYALHMSDGFRSDLDAIGAEFGLSADDIANRAHFAGSCIGCHQEAIGASLGQGVFAPLSNSFVHVQESAVDCGGLDRGSLCFQRSSGLEDVFLPSRLQVMARLLEIPVVGNPCEGSGGAPGVGGAVGMGGGSSVGGSAPGGGTVGVAGAGGVGFPDEPAPEVDIELPSASEPIDELQAQDEEIREAYGDQTLSGRSAQSTH
jgi:hypothetical protein